MALIIQHIIIAAVTLFLVIMPIRDVRIYLREMRW